jgi:hypothetical protein
VLDNPVSRNVALAALFVDLLTGTLSRSADSSGSKQLSAAFRERHRDLLAHHSADFVKQQIERIFRVAQFFLPIPTRTIRSRTSSMIMQTSTNNLRESLLILRSLKVNI